MLVVILDTLGILSVCFGLISLGTGKGNLDANN